MEAFVQYAQKVMKAVTRILPFPISLTDVNGVILADSQYNRVGKIHLPSKEVIEKNDYILYEEQEVAQFDDVFPGVAVPLFFNQQVVGVLGIIGPPSQVMPHAQLIKKYVELMWQEVFYKQLEELEEKTLDTFVQYVLLNEEVDQNRIKQYCDLLKIDMHSHYFCILIDIGDTLMHDLKTNHETHTFSILKKSLLTCTRKIFMTNRNDICTYFNTEKIIVMKSISSKQEYFQKMKRFKERAEELQKLFMIYHVKDVLIVAGSLSTSLKEINYSYHEGERLLAFAKRGKMKSHIYSYYDWDVLLKQLPDYISPTLTEHLRFRMTPLIEDESFMELKRDFMMYCDKNMNLSKAAKALYIHRNTLIYRMKKLETITSLDTRNFQHCMILYVLLEKFT